MAIEPAAGEVARPGRPVRRRSRWQALTRVAAGIGCAAAVAFGVTSLLNRPATPAAPNPSGMAMPTGNLPGWRQTLAENFSGTTLNRRNWYVYSGEPGSDPNGYWLPSHVYVGGGMLHLVTYQADTPHGRLWASGGVGGALAQTYGKYEVRMRADGGAGISVIALLWPADNQWPPEVDFTEDAPRTNARDLSTASLVYGLQGGKPLQVQKTLRHYNFTHWNTLGVVWTPGKLVYTIDGHTWATMVSPHVPDIPMTLDLQAQALTSPAPGPGTPARVDYEIDWVVAYQRA